MNQNLNSEVLPHTAVRIGALDLAGNRAQSFKEAAELRASAPVFVAPVDEALMDHMNGRAILRQGSGCRQNSARCKRSEPRRRCKNALLCAGNAGPFAVWGLRARRAPRDIPRGQSMIVTISSFNVN